MYLNNFSVRIVGGNEKPGGYVEMRHGQKYSIALGNNRAVQCDAKVTIDGEHVGTFRVDPLNTITIERPVNDTGRFTFYLNGTRDAEKAELHKVNRNDLGLISVEFTPEAHYITTTKTASLNFDTQNAIHFYRSDVSSNSGNSRASQSGGTGLSGNSNQNYRTANNINYDHDQKTTINLRLVGIGDDGPRPLTQRSNPVPPPL